MSSDVEVFGNVVDGNDSLTWDEVKGGVHYCGFAHDPQDPEHVYIDGGPACAACGLYGYNTLGHHLVFRWLPGLYVSGGPVHLRNPSYRLCDFHDGQPTAPLPEKTFRMRGDRNGES